MRSLGFLLGAAIMWGSAGPALGHADLHERIEALGERLEESPDDVELLLRRADLYRQHREFDLALRDVDAVERLGGRKADVLLLRGRTLLECGRDEEAARALGAFLSLRSGHAEGWLLLARARRGTGDHPGSVAAYERAIALMQWPGPELYLERADEVLQAGSATGSERPVLERALAGIEEGIERLGPVVTLELRAADLDARLGRVNKALARIDAIMEQAARKEVWLVRKADILARAQRREEALATYRAARNAIDARRAHGRSHALREQIECAIERLERAETTGNSRESAEAADANQ